MDFKALMKQMGDMQQATTAISNHEDGTTVNEHEIISKCTVANEPVVNTLVEPSGSASASMSLDSARTSYFEVYYDAAMLAERICAGEVVDDMETLCIFNGLKNAYENYCKIRSADYPDMQPIPLISYGVPVASPELAIEANRLIGEGNQAKDIVMVEHGKWLLFCAAR